MTKYFIYWVVSTAANVEIINYPFRGADYTLENCKTELQLQVESIHNMLGDNDDHIIIDLMCVQLGVEI